MICTLLVTMILPVTGMNTSVKTPYEGSRNEAPTSPIITGPDSGKPGVDYEFTFLSTDPEGDEITYCMKWGDGQSFCIGPYPSGEEATCNYMWEEAGEYTIEATASDPNNATSEPSYHEISVPRGKIPINTMFLRFLERYPRAFPLIRYLLGL